MIRSRESLKRGCLVTIEGQDGAGKSTNIEVVKSFFDANSIDYIVTREPGGTEFGESIRRTLLNSRDENFGAQAELLLMFAARAQHLEELIVPALESGTWVLCDRFTDATYAYQGGGRQLDITNIELLEQLVQGDLRPDLTLLLDLPIEVGQLRAGQRSEADRFESQKNEFKARVREAYLSIAEREPQRVKIINAGASLEEVAQQIERTLDVFLHG